MALLLILGADRSLESLLVVRRPVVAPRAAAVAADGGEHLGRLLAAHHRDAPVRPNPEEARAVGRPAHAVVAGTEAASEAAGAARHTCPGAPPPHLGPVLRAAHGHVACGPTGARYVL